MKKFIDIIKTSPLFAGIASGDFEAMLDCLSVKTSAYKKDEFILRAGDAVKMVGLIVKGGVRVIKEDIDGNVFIMTEFTVPELFCEAFVCAGVRYSPVAVQASEDAEVSFIDYRKVIGQCVSACPHHTLLIANMLKLLARKSLLMNEKIDIMSKRTTREKLMCFFDYQRGDAKRFTIPYNREELARYLCVDRSAMSNELCKMRDSGLIRFYRNTFEIV